MRCWKTGPLHLPKLTSQEPELLPEAEVATGRGDRISMLQGAGPGFPGDSAAKSLVLMQQTQVDMSSIPGSGRFPGEENDSPLQYSCLGSPMDRGAGRATGLGVRHN